MLFIIIRLRVHQLQGSDPQFGGLGEEAVLLCAGIQQHKLAKGDFAFFHTRECGALRANGEAISLN